MRRKNNESGMILPLVIILMLALTITGLAFLSSSVMEHSLAMREVYKNQAFYLADGGIEYLRLKLSVFEGHQKLKDIIPEPGGSEGTEYRPARGDHISKIALGEGGYWVEYYIGSSPYAISIGQVIKGGNIVGEVITGGEIIVQKKIRIELYETPLFDYLIFGDEGIDIDGSSLIDTVPDAEGGPAKIGTNGTTAGALHVWGAANVVADVYITGDADTIIDGSDQIVGDVSVGPPIDWPIVEEPSVANFSLLPLNILPGDDISISGGWEYPSIDIKGTLTIEAGNSCILLADTLTISGIGEIIIEADADLKIYVRVEARLEGNNITNVDEDPLNCQIYGIGEADIFFRGNTDFYGTMYAPGGDITCRGNAKITGSLIGSTVDVNGNPLVLWDPGVGTGGPIMTNLRNWQEL